MIQTYVIDASVASKWFFREEESEIAEQLLAMFEEGQSRMVVPSLFYSEMGNIVLKKIRRKDCSLAEGLDKIRQLSALTLEKRNDEEFLDVALENAVRFKISVYDSLYLSLAEAYCSPLITADRCLFLSCHKQFDFIELLTDFQR